jgi:Uma2 family endonuclease
MATVSAKLITAEEFARMPNPEDGSQQELVRGEILTMPPPKGLHGACCSKIDRRLGIYVDMHHSGRLFVNDTGFITERDPDTVRGLDIGYWTYERLPQIPIDEYIEVAPDLAVEVLSPGNRPGQIREKVREYFNRGVRMVWIVDPFDRTIMVYRSADEGRIFHENATISGEDVLPGFSCTVSELLP